MKRVVLVALLTLPLAFSGFSQGKKDRGQKNQSSEAEIAFVNHRVVTTPEMTMHSLSVLRSNGNSQTIDMGKIPTGKAQSDEKVTSNERYFVVFTDLLREGFELEGQSATTTSGKGSSTSVTTFTFIKD